MNQPVIIPCFMSIKNANKLDEIYLRLYEMGYDVHIFHTFDLIYSDLVGGKRKHPNILGGNIEDVPPNAMDCGNNTELFIALASINSDIDNEWRWVVCKTTGLIHKQLEITKADTIQFRKATAQEIVEHFKNEPK